MSQQLVAVMQMLGCSCAGCALCLGQVMQRKDTARNSQSPRISGSAGSGAVKQKYELAGHSWSYRAWLPAGFCPDWADLAESECRAGNTSGARSRLGTHSLALVLCETQVAGSSR